MNVFTARPRLWLAALLLVTGLVITTSMLRTSTTFDEIVMVAGGARGYETGDWDMAPEHPPFVQYMYGILPFLDGLNYPDETGVTAETRSVMAYRYLYAQQLFWLSGNDPERTAFLGRLPAVLCALGLIALVFGITHRLAGPGTALLAALLVAVLPDLLTHGGIAYNDVPLALAFLAATFSIDGAIRRPSPARAALAGALIAIALGVKNSAVALGPVAVVLLVWEAVLRRSDRDWLRRIGPAALVTLASVYVGLVIIYRGDFALEEYRYALGFAFSHVTELPVPSYLLGTISVTGFWYFFPLVFFLKTPAGLHVLGLIALGYFVWRLRSAPARLARTPLRPLLVGLVVFGALLLTSSLNIGFRYALPVLPFICMLTAIGVVRAVRITSPAVKYVVMAAAAWAVIHVATFYPFFLSYVSEYGPGRERAYEVLADSNVDWGQGLLELRAFMREHDIPSVYLSYFGSALPEGYGIRFVPLTSFFPLRPQPPLTEQPKWLAVSSTNLTSTYFTVDQFRRLRTGSPAHVVGGSIYLYPVSE